MEELREALTAWLKEFWSPIHRPGFIRKNAQSDDFCREPVDVGGGVRVFVPDEHEQANADRADGFRLRR